MITTLVSKVIRHKPTPRPSILKRVLEELDIASFTPGSVAEYKRDKLEHVEFELRPADSEEIKKRDFSHWECFELLRLRKEIAGRDLTGDEPVIRFWQTPRFAFRLEGSFELEEALRIGRSVG